MRGLLGDRFLRRFAGNLRLRRKHPASNIDDQNPAAEGKLAVGTDNHFAKENREKETAEAKDMPGGEEQN